MNNIIITYGTNVRKFRLSKNISQEKLAELCNLHRTYISDIEEGAEPENLLLFTKMQEISEDKNSNPQSSDDDLTKAIDAEMEELKLKQ